MFNEIVAERTLTSNESEIVFSGLDLESDGGWTIFMDIIPGGASSYSAFGFRVNGLDGSTANGVSRYIASAGSSFYVGQNASYGNPVFAINNAGSTAKIIAHVSICNGYFVANIQDVRGDLSELVSVFNKLKVQQANVNTLAIHRLSGDGLIGAGSTIKICRWRRPDNTKILTGLSHEPVVWSHQVTDAAVTEVVAEGLDLARDGEYQIFIAAVSNTGTDRSINLCVNNDTTATDASGNYLYATGTSLANGTNRDHWVSWCGVGVGQIAFSLSTIALVDGYLCASTIGQRRDNSENIIVFTRSHSRIDNLTRLTFKITVLSGIGVGSKFFILRKR